MAFVRTGHGKDRIEPGDPSMGDEAFLTIEEIIAARFSALALREDASNPQSGSFMAKAARLFLFSDLGQEALFLRRISSQEDGHGTHSLGKNHKG